MADLESVLGVDNLVGVMQSVKSNLPRVLPDEYYEINRTVEGDMIGFDDDRATRKTMPITGRDSPAREFVVDGLRQKYARALTMKGRLRLKPTDVENIRAPGGTTRERRGLSEVRRVSGKANDRLENTRIAATHMMLIGGGVIYYDNDGNLLPDSTGAINSVDAGVPAENQDQLNGIIDVSWDDPTADIASQMRNLHTQAETATGYKLRTACYGANIMGYLCANNCVENILQSHAPLAAAFSNIEIPDGFLGFSTWVSGASAFWVDSEDTVHYELGPDQIAFLPEAGQFHENVEGSYPVPNGDGVFPSIVEATASFVDVTGKFAYAWTEKDPSGVAGVYGDTYLPFLKVANSVYIATVKFP
jgi:hypothetical protein